MSSASPNPEVVVLTGAGASVKLGIPAMEGMIEKYRQQLDYRTQAGRAMEYLDKIRVARDLEERLLAIERAIEFLDSTEYKLARRIIARSSERRARSFRSGLNRLKTGMQALRNHLLGWIATTCFQYDRDWAERIWGELCKVLADKAYPVFTTNYDFAIEDTAKEKGVTVVDNFMARGDRWFWDESLSSFEKAGLRIMKLHGSVNWYMPKHNKTIERVDVGATISREGIPVERVVIFPTRFKDIYETHYFALYAKFLEALRGAKVLIVIGHSLRDEYIGAAIRESFRNPEFHLVAVSPRPLPWPDILKASGRGASRITHVPFKFEEFSLALECVLQDAAPSEVPKRCAEIVRFLKRKRKSKISFDRPPRSISKPFSLDRVVRIEALALRGAELVVTIQDPGDPKAPPINLPTVEEASGKPLTIRGLEKIEAKVRVRLPREVPVGRKRMTLALRQEDGTIIAQKEYVSYIKRARLVRPARKRASSDRG